MEVSGQLHAPAALPAEERAPGTLFTGDLVLKEIIGQSYI